ncbi:MAG: carbohydrate kinase family protein, partial [Alphaproteobacteria bacterium]|nr:carbohydrate kinase family protein [Alphaproteobacteria bacterium]
MAERRSGVLTFGSFITDHNLAIENYPPEDQTTYITRRHLAAGGPGYNLAANLRRLDPDMRVECHGLLGDDENGTVVLDALARHGISVDGMTLTREAPQVYVEVMASQKTGRRTFFFFRGTADLLDESHVDPGASRGRIFHLGAPGLHPRLDRPHPDGGNGWTRVLARARALGFRTNMEMASLEGDILRPIVRPCLPLLDSIVINDLEGEAVTEIEIRPKGVLDWAAAGRACRRLREMGVRQVAAIHFPEGAVAVDAEGALHAQASVRWPDSRIVSAVGAGDAFAAGLVYGLHEGWPV